MYSMQDFPKLFGQDTSHVNKWHLSGHWHSNIHSGMAVQQICLLLLLLITKIPAKSRSLSPAGENEADSLRKEDF